AGGLAGRASTLGIPVTGGTRVTVGASVGPAVKASRVAPLAALRDVAVDRAGASPARAIAGISILAAGVAVTLTGSVGGAGLPVAGLGAVLTIVGVVVFGPVVARLASAVIGAPLRRWRG